jgi:capsular polysaccharide biosynthesis protein
VRFGLRQISRRIRGIGEVKSSFSRIRRIILKEWVFPSAGKAMPGRSAAIAKALLKTIYHHYRIVPLLSYDDASVSVAELFPAVASASGAPSPVGQTAAEVTTIMPAIRLRQFKNAVCHYQCAAIQSGSSVAVPAYYTTHPTADISDGRVLIAQRSGMGLLRPTSARTIDAGIAVFGAGCANWYHWLIEVLPAAMWTRGTDVIPADVPLLVPAFALERPTFRDALTAAANGRPVLPLGPKEQVLVTDLYVADPPVLGPMNLVSGAWPVPADYAQNPDALRRFRQGILDSLGLTPVRPHRRLFLARTDVRRRYNQDDCTRIAQNHGFEIVFPETMTFREQVATYLESEVIMGASGAAFANMLFCQKGAKALTWLPQEYSGFCAYSNLAAAVGVELRCIFFKADAKLNSTHDAYAMGYRLDPAEIDHAIRTLLDRH